MRSLETSQNRDATNRVLISFPRGTL
jgi:hypothetical protein